MSVASSASDGERFAYDQVRRTFQLTQLAGEPWCFTPNVLASLTNEQIQRLYFAPRDDKGQLIIPEALRIAAIKAENNPDVMPTREEFVAAGVEAHPGVDVQYWHDMYEAMLKKVADGGS